MMIGRTLESVTKIDDMHVECRTKTDFGVVTLKRTFRKHTKEIREMQKNGIYVFEIQGIFYYYTFDENGNGIQYKEPENFRSENRTTNELKTQGRKSKTNKTSVELIHPVVKPKKEEPVKEIPLVEEEKEIRHEKYNLIKTCIEQNEAVYLVGDAGTGKNFTLEQIAWDLGLDFYFTNSVQQEYKITGFIDAGGVYHETEFYKAFTKGGLFFLDEMDASIPEVLVLLNAALANRYFEFPTGRVEANENFRVVAAGNTVGSGADEMYTGRLVLDQATLDRFVTIKFDYDRRIELDLAKGNTELVDFIEELRTQARTNGIRATFSYRCIMAVTKLEKAGIDINTLLEIAVFKGLGADTINTFNKYTLGSNKYMKVFREEFKVA